MLKVTGLQGLSSPKTIAANVVVVEDLFGNPIVVVYEDMSGVSYIVRSCDADFNKTLAALGINKVVVDTPIKNSAAASGSKLLYDPRLIT